MSEVPVTRGEEWSERNGWRRFTSYILEMESCKWKRFGSESPPLLLSLFPSLILYFVPERAGGEWREWTKRTSDTSHRWEEGPVRLRLSPSVVSLHSPPSGSVRAEPGLRREWQRKERRGPLRVSSLLSSPRREEAEPLRDPPPPALRRAGTPSHTGETGVMSVTGPTWGAVNKGIMKTAPSRPSFLRHSCRDTLWSDMRDAPLRFASDLVTRSSFLSRCAAYDRRDRGTRLEWQVKDAGPVPCPFIPQFTRSFGHGLWPLVRWMIGVKEPEEMEKGRVPRSLVLSLHHASHLRYAPSRRRWRGTSERRERGTRQRRR